jgi:hypothetical protein
MTKPSPIHSQADLNWPAGPVNIYILGKYTYKKENKIFLIYKKIQKGAVAKSYLTNGLLICDSIFALFLNF